MKVELGVLALFTHSADSLSFKVSLEFLPFSTRPCVRLWMFHFLFLCPILPLTSPGSPVPLWHPPPLRNQGYLFTLCFLHFPSFSTLLLLPMFFLFVSVKVSHSCSRLILSLCPLHIIALSSLYLLYPQPFTIYFYIYIQYLCIPYYVIYIYIYQFSSVTLWCPTLCNYMDCCMPGFPAHHQLLELAQTPVNWVGDAIQPSHPLSSPSPAFSLSQCPGLCQWVSSLHQMAKVLELQLSLFPLFPHLFAMKWWAQMPWS